MAFNKNIREYALPKQVFEKEGNTSIYTFDSRAQNTHMKNNNISSLPEYHFLPSHSAGTCFRRFMYACLTSNRLYITSKKRLEYDKVPSANFLSPISYHLQTTGKKKQALIKETIKQSDGLTYDVIKEIPSKWIKTWNYIYKVFPCKVFSRASGVYNTLVLCVRLKYEVKYINK